MVSPYSAFTQVHAEEEVVHGACVVLDESAQYPVQHEMVVEQASPAYLHSGVSQKQAVPLHGIFWLLASSVRHCRPWQQFASVVHDCEGPEHAGGGAPHTPLLHTSVALQQGIVAEQACEVCAQVGTVTGAAQVPWVAPAGMSQVSGEQQSPFTVQLPPVATHEVPPGVAHLPVASQNAEQHCALEVHDVPSGTHDPQTTPSKHHPVQHSSPFVQLAPGALQVGAGVPATQ